MGRKYGFSFSAKRALGISSFKGSIARATGIPTTRSGLYRKIGRALTGGMLSSGGGQHKGSRKTFGVSFSLNRALGISGAKNSIARAIGIPTTAAGLERKIGKMVVDGVTGGTSVAHSHPTTGAALPAAGQGVPFTPIPVETGILCSLCDLALFPDEVICPRCATPAPGVDAQAELRLLWVDLDALRPVERAMVNLLGEHLTDTQLAKRLSDAGLPIEEHPLVALVRHWGEFSCTHSTHTTPEKREDCLNRQAGKVALHTLQHHLATLVGLSTFAHAPAPVRYAVWLCDDASEHCPLCQQREGIAIPASTRRLPIIDPFCDCNLHIMPPGHEDTVPGRRRTRFPAAGPAARADAATQCLPRGLLTQTAGPAARRRLLRRNGAAGAHGRCCHCWDYTCRYPAVLKKNCTLWKRLNAYSAASGEPSSATPSASRWNLPRERNAGAIR